MFNILNKIENKRRIDIKNEFNNFTQKLNQSKIISNYINNIYSQKNKDNEIINNYKNDDLIENFYKNNNNYNYSSLIQEESSNYSNIIIPKYIMDKYDNENKNFFIEPSNEKNDKIILRELEKPLYSIKSKYYNNTYKFNNIQFLEESKISNEDENKNKNNILLGQKRYKYDKLNDIIIPKKDKDIDMNKNIFLNDILDIICNCPGINIKTLRKLLNINSNNFYIQKNIITYLINMGILYAQDYDDKNLETNDDTKLFPNSDINWFI